MLMYWWFGKRGKTVVLFGLVFLVQMTHMINMTVTLIAISVGLGLSRAMVTVGMDETAGAPCHRSAWSQLLIFMHGRSRTEKCHMLKHNILQMMISSCFC